MSKQGTWRGKFLNAFRGLAIGMRGQSSFHVHGLVSLLVVILAAILRVPTRDWCLLVFAMGLVFVTETINSSLEWLARAVTSDRDDRVGRSLDIAAGGVLIASLTAGLIGLLVLGPPLWARLVGS